MGVDTLWRGGVALALLPPNGRREKSLRVFLWWLPVLSTGGPRAFKDTDSPVSEHAAAVRVCLRDFGLGLASIIPRESGKLCDGNAGRLRLDELPAFEVRRELEVGSEPALLQRDYDVEKVRPGQSRTQTRNAHVDGWSPLVRCLLEED